MLVGEMRDLETIALTLTLAETGHLVFATLHTNDAAQTVDRIIDVFPSDQQDQIRTQFSMALAAVISQRLDPPHRRRSGRRLRGADRHLGGHQHHPRGQDPPAPQPDRHRPEGRDDGDGAVARCAGRTGSHHLRGCRRRVGAPRGDRRLRLPRHHRPGHPAAGALQLGARANGSAGGPPAPALHRRTAHRHLRLPRCPERPGERPRAGPAGRGHPRLPGHRLVRLRHHRPAAGATRRAQRVRRALGHPPVGRGVRRPQPLLRLRHRSGRSTTSRSCPGWSCAAGAAAAATGSRRSTSSSSCSSRCSSWARCGPSAHLGDPAGAVADPRRGRRRGDRPAHADRADPHRLAGLRRDGGAVRALGRARG